MCGIIGIYGNDYVAGDIYDGLTTLQHRGQDASGIVTYSDRFHAKKGVGLIKDVYSARNMMHLRGNLGIGHTRYSTMGGMGALDAQPFMTTTPFGIAIAQNGNVFNGRRLKQELFENDNMLINSNNDGEVMLGIIADALIRQRIKGELRPEHIWKALSKLYGRCQGAYSIVSIIAGQGLLAFRDPHGIRPLVWGKRETGLQTEYCFASETVTLDILGFKVIGDVENGEAIFIDKNRKVHRKIIKKKTLAPSMFEYIYFARPDSVLNGISVYKARMNLGKALVKHIKEANINIDVIVPVPDSGRTAALEIAKKLKIPYREGLVKNRYIGRTFIMPGQQIRQKSIRSKLNAMSEEMAGKSVLLVDDSIVRGNTSRKIVQMVRDSGAKKVYLAIFSPPVAHPDVYGIDIPTFDELIAHHYSIDEIRKHIGADGLYYLTIAETIRACRILNPKIKKFDAACFDGKYITGNVTEEVLKMTAASRDNEKCEVIDGEEDDRPEDQLTLV